jgi:predicted TIM-barrel fold metal-dependent hydrolase
MVVDFQHHYVPVELAKKRGLYSDKTTYLQEGGRRATTMHARLYDLDLQLKEMNEAGVDVSVLSCLLGWNASLDECRPINDDLAKVQAQYPGKFVGLAQAPVLEGKEALQEIERAIQSVGLKELPSHRKSRGSLSILQSFTISMKSIDAILGGIAIPLLKL